MLAVLYDIHANLPALDAVVADARSKGAERFFLGGDFAGFGPFPHETLALLRSLENTAWIRGNGERWLREPPQDRPEVMEVYDLFLGGLPEEEIDVLYTLPPQAEIEGVLYVHGSPLSDVDSFAPESQEDEARMLAGVRDRTVVFGHSHQQFRRPGPDGTTLVNPGSVGMPLDGDRRAAWAVSARPGEFELRRCDYDVERAAAAYREMGGDFGEFAARRIQKGSD